MNVKRMLKLVAIVGAGALAVVVAVLTYSAGRMQCPQCGYLHDCHSCNYCGWTACLGGWQQRSRYNTCPNCGRANP